MDKFGVFEINNKELGFAAGLVAAAALLTSAVVLTSNDHDDRSREIRGALDSGRAKNVILFIGDGMGDSEITIARNYQAGAAGRLRMDSLPLTGAYTTYALQEASPSLIDYVTDSAASGTGWATGHKTSPRARAGIGRLLLLTLDRNITDTPIGSLYEEAEWRHQAEYSRAHSIC